MRNACAIHPRVIVVFRRRRTAIRIFSRSPFRRRIPMISDTHCENNRTPIRDYHKKEEIYDYFAKQRRYLEVFQLPPYWPELNAQERIWNYTRKHATHNRYFESPGHLCRTLLRTFENVRRHAEEIPGLMQPFL